LKDIFIIQRIFPTYRKPIFDALSKKINFTLLHSTNESGIKQTNAEYSTKIKKWKYGINDTHLFLFVFGSIFRFKPKVVIHELAAGIISLPIALLCKKLFGYKLILWGHMYDHKIGFDPQNKFIDKYRLWLQNKADALITYSEGEKNILVKNQVNEQKIFVALNTLNTNKFLSIRNDLDKKGKETIKRELDFKFEYNLIYIGRLYEDKLPNYLIEVLQKIKTNNKDLSVAIHFVGSGTMENKLKEFSKKYNLESYVFFHGEIYDEEKSGKLLFASDIMVMPGCVGLSVNHAFCFDCPVVTFESLNHVPAHGPEIEYIIHQKTGFIVKNNNLEHLATTIESYLLNIPLQNSMKSEIRNMVENICTIDKFVDSFSKAITFTKSN